MNGNRRLRPDLSRRLQVAVLLAAVAACLAALLLLAAAALVQRQEAAARAMPGAGYWMLLAAIACVALMLGALVRVVRIAAQLIAPGPSDVSLPESGSVERALQRTELQAEAAERRRSLLERALSVGRATTGVLDPDVLMRQAVEATCQSFELDCVGLFLVDDVAGTISLRSGVCENGEVIAPYTQSLGLSQGRPGWSIASAELRVSSEDAADLLLRGDAGLPGSRIEAVVPLRDQGRAIGALVLQDHDPDALSEDSLAVLQEMADQISDALGAARAFAEVEGALRSAHGALGQASRDALLRALPSETPAYRRLPNGTVEPTADYWGDDDAQAVAENRTVRGDRALIIPIRIWDAAVGTVRVQKPDEVPGWTDRELALAGAVVEQLGYALESARMRAELRSVGARTQLVREVAERFGAAQDRDALMQVAAEEIGRALQASRVSVQWAPAEPDGSVPGPEARPQDELQDL